MSKGRCAETASLQDRVQFLGEQKLRRHLDLRDRATELLTRVATIEMPRTRSHHASTAI